MSNKEPGYVYILTHSTSGRLHICKNPGFREDWVKIWKNSRPANVLCRRSVLTHLLSQSSWPKTAGLPSTMM